MMSSCVNIKGTIYLNHNNVLFCVNDSMKFYLVKGEKSQPERPVISNVENEPAEEELSQFSVDPVMSVPIDENQRNYDELAELNPNEIVSNDESAREEGEISISIDEQDIVTIGRHSTLLFSGTPGPSNRIDNISSIETAAKKKQEISYSSVSSESSDFSEDSAISKTKQ